MSFTGDMTTKPQNLHTLRKRLIVKGEFSQSRTLLHVCVLHVIMSTGPNLARHMYIQSVCKPKTSEK